MARTLYRIYLYGVWLFLMIFATVAVGVVLGTLLSNTPLNGQYQPILSGITVTQQVIFALLAVIVAGLLGGLHYWLIRRDIRDDPAAATGPVRALFLNGVEAIAILVAVPAIANALSSLAYLYGGGIAGPLAAGIVALGLFALLETERRQSTAAPGAAIVLQRLHFYGVQLILLFIATAFWSTALNETVSDIVTAQGNLPMYCGPVCGAPPQQVAASLFWRWISAAVVTLALVGYGFLARRDTRSALRLVLHFAGYAYGLIFLLVALSQAASFVLQFVQGQTVTPDEFLSRFQFITPTVVGLLAIAMYAIWLARDAMRGTMSAQALGLTALALTTGILAVPFWIGCAMIAYNLLTIVSPATLAPTTDAWNSAIAALITGIGYVPFSLRMRVLARRYTPATPRRGLVFAMLGAGTLTAAVGLIVLLYAVLTAAVGASLDNWQTTARSSGVALFIGAIIVGIYFTRAQVEGWFRRATPASSPTPAAVASPEPATNLAPSVPATPAEASSISSASSQTIEGVLDALLAGKLTRDEAVAQLRALPAAGA